MTTCCTVLGTARCRFALCNGNQKFWQSNQTFLLFEISFDAKVSAAQNKVVRCPGGLLATFLFGGSVSIFGV